MSLRVRHSGGEFVLPDAQTLAALYRGRRIQGADLVWHPIRGRWIRIDAFLFLDSSDASPGASSASGPCTTDPVMPERLPAKGNGSAEGAG